MAGTGRGGGSLPGRRVVAAIGRDDGEVLEHPPCKLGLPGAALARDDQRLIAAALEEIVVHAVA